MPPAMPTPSPSSHKTVQSMIEKSITKPEIMKRVSRMHYTMDFGDLVIQCEICSN
ncbi:hypothetical protein ACFL96_10845 [Thermoproteota archaeon]